MTTSSRIHQLHDAGVSVWLDDLSRPLLDDGVLERYVTEHGLSGVTSNPSIFAAALRGSDRYDPAVQRLRACGVHDARALFFSLALRDVGEAATLLRDLYERSDGRDGYVSFECTPDVATDTRATVAQALQVWRRIDAPNLMMKVPATAAGIPAIEELTAAGVNVNVTLLFSAGRYEQAARAYQRGLARRAALREPIDRVRSVASVFVSRIDTQVAEILGDDAPRESVAVANARLIYGRAVDLFDGAAWSALRDRGASWQRPLWASTAPKDPDVRDVAYVEALALPDTIVTVPEKTLLAFADHGTPHLAAADDRGARALVDVLSGQGLELDAVGAELEAAGVRAFADAYAEVLERLEERAPPPAIGRRSPSVARA